MPLKLTDQQVQQVRKRAAGGESRRDLANFFGVSLETVSRYIRGDSRTRLLQPAEEIGMPSAVALQESAKRLLAVQETRSAQEQSGPPAAPGLSVPGEGALSRERVRWLLGE